MSFVIFPFAIHAFQITFALRVPTISKLVKMVHAFFVIFNLASHAPMMLYVLNVKIEPSLYLLIEPSVIHAIFPIALVASPTISVDNALLKGTVLAQLVIH